MRNLLLLTAIMLLAVGIIGTDEIRMMWRDLTGRAPDKLYQTEWVAVAANGVKEVPLRDKCFTYDPLDGLHFKALPSGVLQIKNTLPKLVNVRVFHHGKLDGSCYRTYKHIKNNGGYQ